MSLFEYTARQRRADGSSMHPPINGDGENKSIEALLEDPEFQKLERSLAESTLFDVLGIAFEERTHSRMLGWLLDPSESHGLGATFLRRFLYDAAKLAENVNYDGNGRRPTPLHAETYSFSDVAVDPEYVLPTARRPDLVLSSEDESWLCLIENKILAGEGHEQTTDYYKEALKSFPVGKFRHRLFVYLSPEGTAPASKHFVPMPYLALEGLLGNSLSSASSLGRIAIDQYLKCLRGRIVQQEHLRDVCWKLYRIHRTAIDKIVQYGNRNLLASMTLQRVLEVLRKNEDPTIPGRQIEWETKGGERTSFGIWSAEWPLGVGGWGLAFYEIRVVEASDPNAEKILVLCSFNQADGRRVRDRFIDLARSRGLDDQHLLRKVPVVSRDLNDLSRAADEGASALRAIIAESFELIEKALRELFPERWRGSES